MIGSGAGVWTFSPIRVMTAAAIAGFGIALLCVLLATRQPWLGLELARAEDRAAPLLVVSSSGPAQAVPEGARLLALSHARDRLVLRSDDAAPEPDMAFVPFDSYNAFFARQDEIADVLAAPRLVLELDGGRRAEVFPAPHRPIADLPFEFWLQLAAGLGSVLAGGGLLAFRQSDPAVRYCVLAGFGIMLAACTAAIYTTRELALPGTLFLHLQAINHFGGCLAGVAFLATIWLYPRPLTRRNPGPALLLVALLWWLAERLQWLPTGAASSALLIVLGFAVGMVLSLMQWRRVRGDLRARAALQWFLLSWLGGGGVFVFVILVPALAGHDAGDLLPYAFGMLLLTLVGLTLGVARYRLFDLELWSFRALILIGGAFAVLGLDVLLVSLLHLGHTMSLTVSLLVAGWLYFPARQWLSLRLFAGARQLHLAEVPALLRDVLIASDYPPDRLLPETLNRLFTPLHLERIADSAPQGLCLVDDGLALRVPGIGGHSAWELRFAANGQRLFNRRDLSLAAAVLAVLDRFVAHQSAIERSVEQERARVAQDLHDDVGARLLTLLHRSSGETASAIRDALESLRQSVYSLGPDGRSLSDALASVRAEAADRCEAAGAILEWREDTPLPAAGLLPGGQQDFMRVLREAISNALRHARPTRLAITLSATPTQLAVTVENDGATSSPEAWRPGVGLRGMRSRTQRMGGQFGLEGADGRVRLRMEFPLGGNPLHGGQT